MKFIDYEKYKNDKGIYKITNLINNKIYIGATSVKFNDRYKAHIKGYENGTHFNSKLQNAFHKYAIENFTFETLEIIEDRDTIFKKEI